MGGTPERPDQQMGRTPPLTSSATSPDALEDILGIDLPVQVNASDIIGDIMDEVALETRDGGESGDNSDPAPARESALEETSGSAAEASGDGAGSVAEASGDGAGSGAGSIAGASGAGSIAEASGSGAGSVAEASGDGAGSVAEASASGSEAIAPGDGSSGDPGVAEASGSGVARAAGSEDVEKQGKEKLSRIRVFLNEMVSAATFYTFIK